MIEYRPRRKTIISASIDPDDIDRLDLHARALQRSRSSLIAEAVRRLADALDEGLSS